MSDIIEIVGPDLAQARPIAEVIRELAPMRNGYGAAFLAACKASGIDATVMRDHEGVDALMLGFPLDSQEDARKLRLNALSDQLRRGKTRKAAVIDMLNLLGRFADNQPFASPEELANAYLTVGGRLWVDTRGQLGQAVPVTGDTLMQESWEGFPLRRLLQRYDATIRQKGMREAVTTYVRERGKVHPGSGCIVLEGEGQADA